jgi:hypothetical protein
MNKCLGCNTLGVNYDDFLSLRFRAYTSDDSNHIYSMRKEFGVAKRAVSTVWEALKPFSSLA